MCKESVREMVLPGRGYGSPAAVPLAPAADAVLARVGAGGAVILVVVVFVAGRIVLLLLY